ncbi:MAG: Sec7 domain-containing protein [Amphiamblys sp. WSBS2006]|nr:MAG: Sec7 domain-containing protein [Amphiamblys sp. WSBS2006]
MLGAEPFLVEQLILSLQENPGPRHMRNELIKSLVYLHGKITTEKETLSKTEKTVPFLMTLQTENLGAKPIYLSLLALARAVDDTTDTKGILQTLLAVRFTPGDREQDETALAELANLIAALVRNERQNAKEVLGFYVGILVQKRLSRSLKREALGAMKKTTSVLIKKNTHQTLAALLEYTATKETAEAGLECLSVCLDQLEAEDTRRAAVALSEVLRDGDKKEFLPQTLFLLFQLVTKNTGVVCPEVGYFLSVLSSCPFSDEVAFALHRLVANQNTLQQILLIDLLSEYGSTGTELERLLEKGTASPNTVVKELSYDALHRVLAAKINTKLQNLCCLHKAMQAKRRVLGRMECSVESGVSLLEEKGLVGTGKGCIYRNTGHALYSLVGIDRSSLGIYLSKMKNQETLDEFMEMFDFGGKRIDEALRLTMSVVHISGESQQIDRVIMSFSNVYVAAQSEIETLDAVFPLGFSIMMLNTDLHNTNVKKKMSLPEYIKNLRGLNGEKDFSPTLLEKIYSAIREAPLAEENNSTLGRWTKAAENVLSLLEPHKQPCSCPKNFLEKHMLKLSVSLGNVFCPSIAEALQTFEKFEKVENTEKKHSPLLEKILQIAPMVCIEKKHTELLSKTLLGIARDKRKPVWLQKASLGVFLKISPKCEKAETWRQAVSLVAENTDDDTALQKNIDSFFDKTFLLSEAAALSLFKTLVKETEHRKRALGTESRLIELLFRFSRANRRRLSVFWEELVAVSHTTAQKELFMWRLIDLFEESEGPVEEAAKKMLEETFVLAIHGYKVGVLSSEILLRALSLARGKKESAEDILPSTIRSALLALQKTENKNTTAEILAGLSPAELTLADCVGVYLDLCRENTEEMNTEQATAVAETILEETTGTEDTEHTFTSLSVVSALVAGHVSIAETLAKLIESAPVKKCAALKQNAGFLFKVLFVPMLNRLGRKTEKFPPAALATLLGSLMELFNSALPINSEPSFDIFSSFCFAVAFLGTQNRQAVSPLLREFVVSNYRKERGDRKKWHGLWRGIESLTEEIQAECEKHHNSLLFPTEL